MLHKTVEATVTPTEQGTFIALASTYGTDRSGDRVQSGAFAETIRKWQTSGKKIPLHWDHKGDPEDIIGTVNPATMKETTDGLRVEAQLDFDSARAREVWRLVKANSVGLSFGYLVTAERELADGIRELHTIDLFEISVTPAPMNPDAKVLSWKSATNIGEFMFPSDARIRERLKQLEVEQEVRELAKKSAPIQIASFDC